MDYILHLLFIGFFSLQVRAEVHEFTDKKVHIKTGIDTPSYDLTFAGDGSKVKFNPNVQAQFSLGVSVQNYAGLAWGFRLNEGGSERASRGPTKYQDYRLNLALPHFHLILNHSSYEGFYVQDSGPLINNWDSSQDYYQARDFKASTSQANFTWIFSPKYFSLEATLDQTARQEQSGGSWLAGAVLINTYLHDQNQIIPTAVQANYGDQRTLQSANFTSFNLKGGYGYGLVFRKKFFLSGAVLLGFGPQRSAISGTNFNRQMWRTSRQADAILATGYNGDDNFAGLTVTTFATEFVTDDMKITNSLWAVKAFYGFRL